MILFSIAMVDLILAGTNLYIAATLKKWQMKDMKRHLK